MLRKIQGYTVIIIVHYHGPEVIVYLIILH